MVGSKAASSVKVTIPESGNFVKKAGPCFQPSFVDRHAIYYGNCPHTEFGCRTTQHVLGAGLFPAGFNVIIGVVTLGWLEGSFTDEHSSASLQFERTRYHVDKLKVVLHVTAATILSFIMFITLSILYVLFPSHKALFTQQPLQVVVFKGCSIAFSPPRPTSSSDALDSTHLWRRVSSFALHCYHQTNVLISSTRFDHHD